jgi:hypothetical protein
MLNSNAKKRSKYSTERKKDQAVRMSAAVIKKSSEEGPAAELQQSKLIERSNSIVLMGAPSEPLNEVNQYISD